MYEALRDNATKFVRAIDDGSGRALEELLKTNDMLRGMESQRLRTFCTSECMEPSRDLDHLGMLLFQGNVVDVERETESRIKVKNDEEKQAIKQVCDELYNLWWGPTRVTIFNLLGLFRIIRPGRKDNYLELARFLIKTGVAVDGTDLSGTTAFCHSISTKPTFDPEYAQLLYDAGANPNHRNRYGATVAQEIIQVHPFADQNLKEITLQSLQWYLSHGGNLNIADSDGMVPRRVAERLYKVFPRLSVIIQDEDRRRQAIADKSCSLCTQVTDLLTCSRCKKAKYCPRDKRPCQKLDWPHHKQTCEPADSNS